jgi:GMP synthase (glutamine-hydrolysing)
MQAWLLEHCTSLTTTRFFANDVLPPVETCDMVIVMGGPMGVYDDQQYPRLAEERRFIQTALDSGKRMLGICLGAQLIAHALGSEVSRNPEPEIGWFPVDKAQGAARSSLSKCLPEKMTVLHWHGDTFALPEGGVPLYHSAACINQGFVFDERVVGLQFHLEMTRQGLKGLVDNSRDELVAAPFVQKEQELLAPANPWESANQQMIGLLEWFEEAC